MSDPLNTRDFLAKIEWEGGVEGALEYGLEASDAADPELARRWQLLADRYNGTGAGGAGYGLLIESFYEYARQGGRT